MKSKTPNHRKTSQRERIINQVTNVRQIIERARPFLKEFYLYFTDYSKDCIDCGRKYWANG